ncbi:Mg2+ transporter-C family protein [Thermosulfidibacter takaii ABI70S6]|uniref:Mg2+ transporter-C family protein n=1 Tax=Thermosulfidibacter takaii (strain DSM 17441 / JCM 13301 / NBRC 103674 / ABI70S6) TaxID=1298851 RepID=A0A0S3QT32_THET7|nr:MgtC/SapB family protein [Thermosulfidibacter takaii]BAT71494.1 Mg2+ transporter-C family protein [Thermosulfidibacter takaii ABI70S6]
MGVSTVFFRLFLALVLGGIIGIEREVRNQPAGFRTHAILSIGASLIMIISVFAAHKYGISGKAPGDPTRIAAQIVSGIGFLGAGAILRIGASVKGLTTAASLWATAGVGMACGAGFYSGAIIATGLILLTLFLLGKIEKTYLFTKPKRTLLIEAVDKPSLMGHIEETLDLMGYSMDFVEVERELDKGVVEVQMVIRPKPGSIAEEDKSIIARKLLSIPEVKNVEIR